MALLVTCCISDIVATAEYFTQKMLTSEEVVDAVVDSIKYTGASQIRYSLSVAHLAGHIRRNLHLIGKEVERDFQKKLLDEDLGDPESPEPVDPSAATYADAAALCIFIGTLHDAKVMPFDDFEKACAYLINGLKSTLHLNCIHEMLAYGCARFVPEITKEVVDKYKTIVRRRCRRKIREPTEEETQLLELLRNLGTRDVDETWPEVVDITLNLNYALQASPLVLRNTFMSAMTTSYRLQSTSPTYPYKIFAIGVYAPPEWPEYPSSQNLPPYSPLKWKSASKPLMPLALKNLEFLLRVVHKHKINWPVEDTSFFAQSPRDYMLWLLRPIADIFNQLHSLDVLKEPMECIEVVLSDQLIYGATFVAESFDRAWPTVHPPIVICLSDDLFGPRGEISPRVDYALSKALELKPSTPYLIVSNFKGIVVFYPPSALNTTSEALFERVSTTEHSQALRTITTTFLVKSFQGAYPYINIPDFEPELEVDLVGPSQDPNAPLLTDKELFATHHRHSDFDFISLIHDEARTLQFLRWKEYNLRTLSKVAMREGDVVRTVTDDCGTFRRHPDVRPIYPYDPSELPPDTLAHLEEIRRESPLASSGIAAALEKSNTFTLEIKSIISAGNESNMSTVYRCQITSIDDNSVSSSTPLCLKLFDDRFQKIDALSEDLDDPRWYDYVLFGETYAHNEATVYDKLFPVQGTVISWFYGVHQFVLPNGFVLCGVLMELVDGGDLHSDCTKGLSKGRIIRMIQSCRHATRVLDVADVCQCDWHLGQILLHTTTTTTSPTPALPQHEHTVFIDFASAVQTYHPDDPILLNNYNGVARVLARWARRAGLDPMLVVENFDEPDEWDPNPSILQRPKDDGTFAGIVTPTLFPFISFEASPPVD
ncbi:hypothetical protein BDN70DRAFT_926829 [Pholiota conissans]|uniref:Uncharacterized protein n=1 Tax=Pholiota conissans TaxID=109636 RepID=A0A9P5ZGB7_9AGAR|nr:hypothetical protein BDN70DRAFT_926829 [Pholiota conissans]